MSEHKTGTVGAGSASDYQEALAFSAPYLVEKVIEEGLAATVEEAESLFLEVKRYIVMSHATFPRWGISSYRVDEVWHNFVLYTHEYAAWCHQYFGRFMHHAPSNAPKRSSPKGGAALPLDANRPKDFAEHYRSFFGIDLPDVWRDELNVTIRRRAIGTMGGLSLRPEVDDLRVVTASGEELFVADRTTGPALQFMFPDQPFFVRELPGDLSDEAKIGLVSALVARRLVRLY